MKKKLSLIWFAGSVLILPCILDLENFGCLAVITANALLSYRAAKKNNPELVLTNNKNDYDTDITDTKSAAEGEKGCCD